MGDSTVVDPLGRAIVLHDHTWYGHVLLQHPEMRRHRDLVEKTLAEPLEIRVSDADPDVRLYFGDGPRNGIIVAVVANIVGGFVKTAHLIKRPRGKMEWSKPTP